MEVGRMASGLPQVSVRVRTLKERFKLARSTGRSTTSEGGRKM